MKYKIIFSENAKRDLISIVRYISDELLEPNLYFTFLKSRTKL